MHRIVPARKSIQCFNQWKHISKQDGSEWCPPRVCPWPYPFLIYENDLHDLLQGDVLLFTDDVKLISAIANFDDLRRDLQHAWDWAWDLPLNANKCGHISIDSAPTRPLTLSDTGISSKLLDITENLVITIYSSFKPSMHCAQAFKRARAALFFKKKLFVTLTPEIFNSIYSTSERPHREYAIQASSPYLEKDIDHLECLKRIASYSNSQRLSGQLFAIKAMFSTIILGA